MAKKIVAKPTRAENYKHPQAESPMRPEIGTQAQFKKAKPPRTYRYDSSLSPAMDWDGQNPAREEGERLVNQILDAKDLGEAKAAGDKLKALGKPFLNWAGKAERLSFDVPSLPLFVHERLSTKAIIETLKAHRKEETLDMFDLFGDPHHSVTEQILRAYEHKDKWVNRMILGDSLVVMNSLLEYEGLGGQVQMIFIDPPYGVQFGSNFQPFLRKRAVLHNDDEDMTREPEMVQAYRDTWEMGLHSYLSYMRDRLLLARRLLAKSGSIFVQISDDNVHHLRELMDEVFGNENLVALIPFKTTSGLRSEFLPRSKDYLCWYTRERSQAKFRPLFLPKVRGEEGATQFELLESPDGKQIVSVREVESLDELLGKGWRLLAHDNLTSTGHASTTRYSYQFQGKTFTLNAPNLRWKTTQEAVSG